MVNDSKIFTPALDKLLVDLVRENPLLYNIEDSNYKNLPVKDVVWNTISAAIGKTVEECRTRWRTIRDSYKKNMRKVDESFKTGTSIPKSKYFNSDLQFLDKTLVKSSCEPTSSSGSYLSPASIQIEAVTEQEAEEQLLCNVKIEGEEENTTEEQDQPVEQVRKKKLLRPYGGRRGKIMKTRNKMKKFVFEDLSIPDVPRVQIEHPLDIFFKSMCETVKTFPQHIAAEARMRVCQVVTEMEIRAIQEGSQTDPLHNS